LGFTPISFPIKEGIMFLQQSIGVVWSDTLNKRREDGVVSWGWWSESESESELWCHERKKEKKRREKRDVQMKKRFEIEIWKGRKGKSKR